MGLYVYIHVHQDENVVFDDLAKLNEELENGEVCKLSRNSDILGEIYDGFVRQEHGKTSFANFSDGYFEGYQSEYVSVYACFEDEALTTIAKHMTSGKLVIRREIEGNPGYYYVLTPGNVKTIEETSIKF